MGPSALFIRRRGESATLRTFALTGTADDYEDKPDPGETETAIKAVVRMAVVGGDPVVRSAAGEDEALNTEVWVVDDVTVTLDGVERRPEIDVGGNTYRIGLVDPHQGPMGVQRLLCRKVR